MGDASEKSSDTGASAQDVIAVLLSIVIGAIGAEVAGRYGCSAGTAFGIISFLMFFRPLLKLEAEESKRKSKR